MDPRKPRKPDAVELDDLSQKKKAKMPSILNLWLKKQGVTNREEALGDTFEYTFVNPLHAQQFVYKHPNLHLHSTSKVSLTSQEERSLFATIEREFAADAKSIFESIQQNDSAKVAEIVNKNPLVLYAQLPTDGSTPLIFALKNANEKMTPHLSHLIAHSDKDSLALRDHFGKTALDHAILKSAEYSALLIMKGVPLEKDHLNKINNENLLMQLLRDRSEYGVIESKNQNAAILAILDKHPEHAPRALTEAIRTNNLELIQSVLQKHPSANFTAQDSEQRTPLLKILLKLDINPQTKAAYTEIACELIRKHPETLLIRDKDGLTPLKWLEASSDRKASFTKVSSHIAKAKAAEERAAAMVSTPVTTPSKPQPATPSSTATLFKTAPPPETRKEELKKPTRAPQPIPSAPPVVVATAAQISAPPTITPPSPLPAHAPDLAAGYLKIDRALDSLLVKLNFLNETMSQVHNALPATPPPPQPNPMSRR